MRPMFASVLAVLFAGLAGCNATTFQSDLTSHGTSPRSRSVLTGAAELNYNEFGGTFYHVLRVSGVKDITGATIRMLPRVKDGCPLCREEPKTGPVVVQLTSTGMDGVYAGTVSQGTFGPEAFVGPLAGHPISGFVRALREGRLYVEVETKAFPDGEIRGKLQS